MRTIHKHRIEEQILDLKLPENFKFLSFQAQNSYPTFWVELDTTNIFNRTFKLEIFGTGHKIPPNLTYLGTCQIGIFVWHLYQHP